VLLDGVWDELCQSVDVLVEDDVECTVAILPLEIDIADFRLLQ